MRPKIKCENCCEHFYTNFELKLHHRKEHRGKRKITNDQIRNYEVKMIKEDDKGFRVANMVETEGHNYDKIQRNDYDKIENESSEDEKFIEETFQCGVCGDSFKSEEEIFDHVKIHEEKMNFMDVEMVRGDS